jgi:hypothetical protein
MTDVTERTGSRTTLDLRVGDLVEVLSIDEILATLDDRGELESLPFMPEMTVFCGRRMTVHKVAHKVCNPMTRTGMRSMTRAVHLTEARCDGSAHGGCQTACSLYWKEAWLKRVAPDDALSKPTPGVGMGGRRSLPLLDINARKAVGEDGEPRYSCQATEILRAAPTPLPMRDMSQFVTDYRTGNAGILVIGRSMLVGYFNRLQALSARVLPQRFRLRKGLPWPFVEGRVRGQTPTGTLNLQPGELVRVKSKEEILATLNDQLLNRGMGFEGEMSRFCGRTAIVQSRVERCLDERTGRMLTMKSPCIVLEKVVCEGAYHAVCPREYVPFWREVWLERV